jgi:hypothetical protein
MPRVVRVVEDVIQVVAGQLPAGSAPFWYSGRGADVPAGDGGGPGGTPAEGRGLAVGGLHADVHALHLVIDAWDPSATGLEIAAEVNRATDGSLEWAPVDRQVAGVGGTALEVRPLRAQVMRVDFLNPGAIIVRVPVIAARLRWGVRGVGAGPDATALHAACEVIRQVD